MNSCSQLIRWAVLLCGKSTEYAYNLSDRLEDSALPHQLQVGILVDFDPKHVVCSRSIDVLFVPYHGASFMNDKYRRRNYETFCR